MNSLQADQAPPHGWVFRTHLVHELRSKPALLATRFDYAVSYHGFGSHDGLEVIVGGGVERAVKERV